MCIMAKRNIQPKRCKEFMKKRNSIWMNFIWKRKWVNVGITVGNQGIYSNFMFNIKFMNLYRWQKRSLFWFFSFSFSISSLFSNLTPNISLDHIFGHSTNNNGKCVLDVSGSLNVSNIDGRWVQGYLKLMQRIQKKIAFYCILHAVKNGIEWYLKGRLRSANERMINEHRDILHHINKINDEY